MSYLSTTDFLALLRQSGNSVVQARMPGVDFIIAALARAGQFSLFVGQSAPTVNQTTTVWIKPSLPSWVQEGTVYLWSTAVQAFVVATPALWAALLSGYSFQSAPAANNIILAGTSLVAIQRAAPTATAIALPAVASQAGKALRVTDWSTGVVGHTVTLSPNGAETIMQQASWQLFSTAGQQAGAELYPSTDLNGWVLRS